MWIDRHPAGPNRGMTVPLFAAAAGEAGPSFEAGPSLM